MALNMKSVLADMTSAAEQVLAKDWPKVKGCVKKALAEEKKALKEIAAARLSGELDDDEMRSEVSDERDALKAALLACKVGAKVTAQKAANAALRVFVDAIKLALA